MAGEHDPQLRKMLRVGWNGSHGYDPAGIPVSRIHLEYEPSGDFRSCQYICA